MHRNSLIGAASVREFRELEHQWRLKSEGIVPGPPNLDGLSIEEPPDVDFPTLDVQREWIRALTDSIRRDIGIMNVSDEEAPHLKQWVVQRLTDISDADPEVLADYALALIRVDTPDAELKSNAIENLSDFLGEKATQFVDDLFDVMRAKSYIPGHQSQQAARSAPETVSQSTLSSIPTAQSAPRLSSNGVPHQSRKRAYDETNAGGTKDNNHYERDDRQTKQMRGPGRRGGRGDFVGRGRGNYHQPISHGALSPSVPNFQGMPLPPPPPGDAAAMLATMQAMGFQLPDMSAFPQPGSPPAPQYGQSSPGQPAPNKINVRCRDYDTKLVCARGVNCPFQHGDDSIIMPDQEYDPKNAVMTNVQMSPTRLNPLDVPLSQPHTHGQARARGRGRGGGDRGGFNTGRRNRAEFSQAGPNHDRSITTIVVEQIPESNFDEHSVRESFSQFGTIEEVDMRPYKRLALSEVIFDNRFVKVFWYKPTAHLPPESLSNGKPMLSPPVEPEIDKEQVMRDAEAAQKKFEEKKAAMKEADDKRQALEKQKADLAKRQAEEKRKLQEKLAAKGQGSPPAKTNSEANDTTTNGVKDEAAAARTRALRAQVAALEAEAKSLGLDQALSDEPYPGYRGRGRGRGRGSYRGWEGFAGRGAYQPRGRGGYRGRGGGFGAYNLDLRPKKVGITGVEWTPEKDEGLRQYLLGLGEYKDISPNPSNPSQLVVSFKQRHEAEALFYGTKEIPSVGKVEMSWVQNPGQQPGTPMKQGGRDGEKMEGVETDNRDGDGLEERNGGKDVDFDVAEVEEDFDVAD